MKIIVLACLLVFSVTASAQKCPTGCVCSKTSGTVSCIGLSTFPTFSDMSVNTLDIRKSTFPDIPSNALSRLSDLHVIKIQNSNIGKIENCAFNDLYLEELSLQGTHIDTIESGAFRNITFGLVTGVFELHNMTIKTIDSFAFISISMGYNHSLTISYADISKIKSQAFYEFYLYKFSLVSSHITHIKTIAFNKFSMEKLDIYATFVERLDCGAFYQGQSQQYSIQLDVKCDCDIAWIIADQLIFQFNDTKCREPANLSGMYVAGLTATQVCPSGFYTRGCAIRQHEFTLDCPADPQMETSTGHSVTRPHFLFP